MELFGGSPEDFKHIIQKSFYHDYGGFTIFSVQALQKIANQGSDLTPIGKTSNDQLEENEDEEDEDEDSESDHEDEDEEDVDMGNNFNQEDHNNQN